MRTCLVAVWLALLTAVAVDVTAQTKTATPTKSDQAKPGSILVLETEYAQLVDDNATKDRQIQALTSLVLEWRRRATVAEAANEKLGDWRVASQLAEERQRAATRSTPAKPSAKPAEKPTDPVVEKPKP